MRKIKAELVINAVKELSIKACCVLREDVKEALKKALKEEESERGRSIIKILLENTEIAETQMMPICQDCGVTTVFVEIGKDVEVIGDLYEAIDEGVRQGYKEGYLRTSVVKDPLFSRVNTSDNTPAFIHCQLVSGEKLKLTVMPKGAGSDNSSALAMLKPSDGIEGVKKFVIDTVKQAYANPCPPIIVGVGVGGSFETVAILAKKALLRSVGGLSLDPQLKELEKEILSEVNNLKIGAAGLGGSVTALGVAIEKEACHMASLPVTVNISCHALRSASVVL